MNRIIAFYKKLKKRFNLNNKGQFLLPVLGAVGSAVGSGVGAAAGAVGSAAGAIGSGIASAAGSALAGLGHVAAGVGGALGKIAGTVGGAVGKVASTAASTVGKFGSAIGNAASKMLHMGGGAAQGTGALAKAAPSVGAIGSTPSSGFGLLSQAPAVGMSSGGAGGLTPGGISGLMGAPGQGGGVAGGIGAEGLGIGGPISKGLTTPVSGLGTSAPAGKFDFMDMAKKLLSQLGQKKEQTQTQPLPPAPGPIGGRDLGKFDMPQFSRPPSTGMLIAQLLAAMRGQGGY